MRKRNYCIAESEKQKIWTVIDTIAKDNGIAASRLARMSGLDATAFNKSKRICDGYCRTPGLTTVMAILRACNLTWKDWARYWDSVK